MHNSIDPVWEEKYSKGHQQRYPWDCVVSFVFRNVPKGREFSSIKVLEVGCGTGSNLWFAAREGMQVAGIDGSASAITNARKRFSAENLEGDFHVGCFSVLPFEAATFDIVIDRGALTCAGKEGFVNGFREIERVVKPGGRFFCRTPSDMHSSCWVGERSEYGTLDEISFGELMGAGRLFFISRNEVVELFSKNWNLRELKRVESQDMLSKRPDLVSEWQIVAERKGV